MNWSGIAVHNLMRNCKSVVSTVTILVIGVVALITGSGFMLYTYDSLQEVAIRTDGHIVLLDRDNRGQYENVDSPLTFSTWQSLVEEIVEIPGVARVLPRAQFEGLINNGDRSAAFFGTAVNPDEEFRVHGPFLRTTSGDILARTMTAEAIPDVILGQGLAQTLNGEVGDVLKLWSLRTNNEFAQVTARFVGTYRTGTQNKDEHSLMISLDAARPLLASDNINQLSIYLDQRQDMERVSQSLRSKFPDMVIETWQQRAELHDKVKALYDRLFGLMGAIIISVVFLAIVNTIDLAIFQRRGEIAILSALGTRTAEIYRMIVLEACLIGLVAVTLGMLLAYVATSAINAMEVTMPAPPGKNEGYPLFIYTSVYQYLGISAALVAVTTAASLVVAFQRGKVNVADAMK